jgi:hypothetical protein
MSWDKDHSRSRSKSPVGRKRRSRSNSLTHSYRGNFVMHLKYNSNYNAKYVLLCFDCVFLIVRPLC